MQYQKVQLDLVSTGRCHTLPHTNIPYFFLQKYGLIFSYIQIYQKYVLGFGLMRRFQTIFFQNISTFAFLYTRVRQNIKKFRNSILTWYMLYLYEWRPKMQKKHLWGVFKSAHFQVPESGTSSARIQKLRLLFHANIPPQWWSRFSFSSFTTFGRVIGKFWMLSSF